MGGTKPEPKPLQPDRPLQPVNKFSTLSRHVLASTWKNSENSRIASNSNIYNDLREQISVANRRFATTSACNRHNAR